MICACSLRDSCQWTLVLVWITSMPWTMTTFSCSLSSVVVDTNGRILIFYLFFVFVFYLFLKYTYKDYTKVSASTWKLHPLKLSFGGVNLERISDLKQACACHPGKINYWESDSTILGHHISFPFIPPSHSPYKYSFALPKVLLRHPILGGEEAGCCDE